MFLNSPRCFKSLNSGSSRVAMGMPISLMSLRLKCAAKGLELS